MSFSTSWPLTSSSSVSSISSYCLPNSKIWSCLDSFVFCPQIPSTKIPPDNLGGGVSCSSERFAHLVVLFIWGSSLPVGSDHLGYLLIWGPAYLGSFSPRVLFICRICSPGVLLTWVFFTWGKAHVPFVLPFITSYHPHPTYLEVGCFQHNPPLPLSL